MARDYRAMEEEFIADLKSRSGRSLAEWMAAVDAAGLTHRDDIIDWLQPQGFTFEHASWLERIHNNGGVPIYRAPPAERRADSRASASGTASASAAPPSAGRPTPAMAQGPPVSGASGAPAAAPKAADTGPEALVAVLARGKAFRMLAELVIAEARRVLPEVVVNVRGDLVTLERPGLLAVLAVTPRELRLGLVLGAHALVPPLVRPRGVGSDAAVTHMLVLTDARQVDDALVELLRRADTIANAAPPNH